LIDEKLKPLSRTQLKLLLEANNIQLKNIGKLKKDDLLNELKNKIPSDVIEKNLLDKIHMKKKEKHHLSAIDREEIKNIISQSLDLKISSLKGSLDQESSKIDDAINSIKAKIDKIEILLENPEVHDTEHIKEILLKLHKMDLDLKKPEDFEKALLFFKRENIDPRAIINFCQNIIVLKNLEQLLKQLEWPEDLGLLYDQIKNDLQIEGLWPGDPIPIPKARTVICNKRKITEEYFDKLITTFFKKGWLLLDYGNPIGDVIGGHLDIDGKKFYLIRTLRR
jgi:hypothetical protein